MVTGCCGTPPQRSSAWRFGYKVPINYNDNEQFCGGAGVQWNQNGGRCGVCGDNYANQVKENEDLTGKYVTGTITGSYVKGANITATVKLTANHKGWWEFRVCPLPNSRTKVTQECLNQYLLTNHKGTTRYDLDANQITGTGEFKVGLNLPDDVSCENCVLQWIYNTGNSWGCDSTTGTCCVGCGPGQENFWNCADIRIINTESSPTTASTTQEATTAPHVTTTFAASTKTTESDSSSSSTGTPTSSTISSSTTTTTPTEGTQTTTPTEGTQTTKPTEGTQTTTKAEGTQTTTILKITTDTPTTTAKPPSFTSTTTSSISSSSASSSSTTRKTTMSPSSTTTSERNSPCKAIGAWFGDIAMDDWCAINCAAGYCPSSHCSCTSVTYVCACEPVPPFNVAGMKEWCCANCALGYCPSTHCSC
ncbi:putative protein TPRXL [Dreissena polymorpha]|uniref:Chitin-binding type-4 domain-containing protein n=1 Tax=Dreissena polymorpha TaxID=45954 RepID=A0A9D4G7H1_DREPO|nr:putative protein TPRXL [Dreissena polymorpha]KAH3809985.1 hypothetical protein DPMN_138367 [Dreissena polymorpha]